MHTEGCLDVTEEEILADMEADAVWRLQFTTAHNAIETFRLDPEHALEYSPFRKNSISAYGQRFMGLLDTKGKAPARSHWGRTPLLVEGALKHFEQGYRRVIPWEEGGGMLPLLHVLAAYYNVSP